MSEKFNHCKEFCVYKEFMYRRSSEEGSEFYCIVNRCSKLPYQSDKTVIADGKAHYLCTRVENLQTVS